MGYIWLRDPTDGRDSRVEWTPPPGPFKVPEGYVHRDAKVPGPQLLALPLRGAGLRPRQPGTMRLATRQERLSDVDPAAPY